MEVMGVGKSEWPGSDDGQDNITCLERGAILRPRLGCELKCGTVDGFDGEDNVRVYGDPALTKPNRQSLVNGATTGLKNSNCPESSSVYTPVAFLSVNSKKA